MYLYFAYGSNMNPGRMKERCPGSIDLGGAILRNYKVAERLYADIDYEPGAVTHGVLYLISEEHVKSLDYHEGYPRVYIRLLVDIEHCGNVYQAITYEMYWETKITRDGLKYPQKYRHLCSVGAKTHKIRNCFK